MRFDSLVGLGALFGAVQALNCSSSAISAILPSNASLTSVTRLSANSTYQVPAYDVAYPTNPAGLPALCAIEVKVQGVANTTYSFGLFLPDSWNGRFLAVGNGGFAGGINWADMGPGTGYGFATMSTDTGHNSPSGNGSWAYHNPEVVANWGYRAMHGSIVVAKQATEAYYAQKPKYNYYLGCSTGGRQGLKEAEFFPDDFDGVVAGAPAWWTTHLQTWTVQVALYNLPATADYHIPASTFFTTIAAEVLKQCDPQDGVVDNIISNPDGCVFHPEALLCGANVTNATAAGCLTSPQIDTLYHLYNDWVGENQTFFFPHLRLGSEAQWILPGTIDNAPNSLGPEYVKYFLGLGPDWNFYDFNEDIVRLSDRMNPGNATVGFDLSAFYKKGGKVLQYHGLADGLIPEGSSPYYYNHVLRTLKPQGINLDDFYRFFQVPGMQHCAGTPSNVNAPWYFAGGSQSASLSSSASGVPGFRDAQHDVLLAMMNWVENGTAPEYIVGTKYTNDTTQEGVLRQRPLCMYPKQAKYKGTGDVDAAESWECKSLY